MPCNDGRSMASVDWIFTASSSRVWGLLGGSVSLTLASGVRLGNWHLGCGLRLPD